MYSESKLAYTNIGQNLEDALQTGFLINDAQHVYEQALVNIISSNKTSAQRDVSACEAEIRNLDTYLIDLSLEKQSVQNEIFNLMNSESLDSLTSYDALSNLDKLNNKSIYIELKFYTLKEKIDTAAAGLGTNASNIDFQKMFKQYLAHCLSRSQQLQFELNALNNLRAVLDQELEARQSFSTDMAVLNVVFNKKKKVGAKIIECTNQIKDIKNQFNFFFSTKTPILAVARPLVIEFNKKLKIFSDIFQARLFLNFQASTGQPSEDEMQNYLAQDRMLKNEYTKLKTECMKLASRLDCIGYIANAVDEVSTLISLENNFLN